MPLARCQAVADTPKNMKILKLNLICVINCTTSKKPTKIWTIDFFKILKLKQRVQLERGQLGFYWLELAILAFVAFIALRTLRRMETPLKSGLGRGKAWPRD